VDENFKVHLTPHINYSKDSDFGRTTSPHFKVNPNPPILEAVKAKNFSSKNFDLDSASRTR